MTSFTMQPGRSGRVRHVTGAEAVANLNSVVDRANKRIAQALAQRDNWLAIARQLMAENQQLRDAIAELTAERDGLQREVDRLKKRTKKRKTNRKDFEG